MGGFPEIFDALNKSGVDFLLADIDAAMAFMDVAEASPIKDTVARNHKKAHEAYDAVVHLLGKLTVSAEKRQFVHTRLGLLKKRLQAVGHQF